MSEEYEPKSTFIIAEAGSNWKCGSYEQDLLQAKELIKTAAQAGADAVKFQTYKAETTYVKDAGVSDYLSKFGIKQSINEIFEHLSMPYEMIKELSKVCKKEKIYFMSTPFSVDDAMAIDPFVNIHKIASFEINHIRLLEFIAKTKKPVIVSTGASNFVEIDFAVEFLKKHGCLDITLLQCTSKYPCPLESLNLLTIPQIHSRYNLPVGLSDHSEDPIIAPMMAVALGSTVIEKHFTLDKNLQGPDHKFALNPQELEIMIKAIRNSEKAKGSGIKDILEDEKELRQFATRSIQSITDISKGDILSEGENFDILRPGNRVRGLDAKFLDIVNGKKATKDISIGDGILDYE